MEEARQQIDAGEIAQFVHDFLRTKMKFKAMLPGELAQVKSRLDELAPKSETYPTANYDLFYRVSGILHRQESPTMGELSSALSVPLSTATRMVDWLVDNGYARRLPDPADRRVVRVAFTERGQRLHQTIESYVAERMQQILSHFTVEERATLFALLRKLVSAL